MRSRTCVRALHRALTRGVALALSAASAAQAPHVSKPKPAPPTTLPTLPPLPPAAYDPTLAIGGDNLKAREIETRLSVDVSVNGRGPYRFLVDSGADTSALGLRVAHQLQLPLGSPAILDGTTSRDLVDRVKVEQLTVGPTTIRNLELPALREADLGGDGLIGIDALSKQRLMLDFERHFIKVEDPNIPERAYPGEIVIVARRRRGQLILTHVSAAGLPLDAIIDTGSEITIGNLALREKLIHGNWGKIRTVKAIGVTGVTMPLDLARISELQLGPVVLRDVPIAFADVAPFKSFGLTSEPALLLGTDILESFRRVSLDFQARKVRFQLRSCKPEGIVISTAEDGTYTRLFSRGGAEVCAR